MDAHIEARVAQNLLFLHREHVHHDEAEGETSILGHLRRDGLQLPSGLHTPQGMSILCNPVFNFDNLIGKERVGTGSYR